MNNCFTADLKKEKLKFVSCSSFKKVLVKGYTLQEYFNNLFDMTVNDKEKDPHFFCLCHKVHVLVS